MASINENYLKLQGNYLFIEIARRVDQFKRENPDADIIRLGIGDVTRPLPPAVVEAMHRAVNEMGDEATFRGYGPEQGYEFLRKRIVESEYATRSIDIDADEIFISDGSKCDTGNFQEIFGPDNRVAVTDPVYPVYVDTNVMAGRSGEYVNSRYNNITYLPCNAENGFIPPIPDEEVDIIYFCYPNNPTGMTLDRTELKKWVEYAKENKAIIFYDAAYEAYITEEGVVHSIYEIDGAKDVAVEFRSFSKHAGFTGTRCAYTVVPRNLKAFDKNGDVHDLHSLWNRRHSTKFNGVPYIVQRGAEAALSGEGKSQIGEIIDYYMTNAAIISKGLKDLGIKVYGGVNSPYVWLRTPSGLDSWEFFDKLLNEAHLVGTPGAGFGPNGQGYFRLTGFGNRKDTEEAVQRIKTQLRICAG